MGVSKSPKLGLPQLWGPITLCANLQLKWGLKKSCNFHWELSNGMSHATWTQGNRIDSWFLVVKSQTTNLTPDLFLDHNLCFRCSNGWCKPILNIYVSIAFQWYKKLFNLMGFDPCIRFLKIRESIGTPTPKMGVHVGVWRFIPSHFFALAGTWNVTFGFPFWLAPLQAPCFGREPKARVATNKVGVPKIN